MTDNHSTKEPQNEIAPEPQVVVSPGALLKAAREQHKLTIDDIARKLNLRVHHIEDIEVDRYDSKISMTFTKGYLKTYAKMVHVPEAQILAAFETQNKTEKQPAKLQSFSRKVAKQASDDRLMMVTYIILAVLVALVVVWWLQQSPEDEKSVLSQLPAAPAKLASSSIPLTQVATEASDASALTLDSGDNTELAEQTDEEDSLEQSLSAPPAAVKTQATQIQVVPAAVEVVEDDAPQTVNAQSVDLVFEFSADCWINIVDGSGEAIAYGIKTAGRIMPVSGVPAFDVTLCAPELVKISYAGVAVDMSQFTAGRTARFSLPLAE